jgi:hypothetical protein
MRSYPARAVTNDKGHNLHGNYDLHNLKGCRPGSERRVKDVVFVQKKFKYIRLGDLSGIARFDLLLKHCLSEGMSLHQSATLYQHVDKDGVVTKSNLIGLDFGHIEYRMKGNKIYTIKNDKPADDAQD